MTLRFRFLIFIVLIIFPCASRAQTTTLTITNSTGLINVPAGVTPNFAALNVGGVSLVLPSGALVGTTASQALTNKTYNGLNIIGNGGSLTLASGKYLVIDNQLNLAGNDGSTVNFGAGGSVAYTTGSYADPSWITSLSSSKLIGAVVATNGVVTSGSYADPSWITALSGAKLTGTVVATNGVVTSGLYNNPPWITSLAWSKLTGEPTTLSGFGITDAVSNKITINGHATTASVTITPTDLSYTRGGNGMPTRTVGAEIDETPITSKGAGAAFNWNGSSGTDDTAAIQRQINSKGELRFSMGVTEITSPLALDTVGQIVKGAGIPNGVGNGTQINQLTSGQDGIHWYQTNVGSDVLPDQGGHASFASFRDFSVRTNYSNTGIGLDLGSDPTYSGDYTSLENLYVEHFETGIHMKSMGLSRWWNVAISGDSGAPSDYGIKFDGGSSNSHFLIGVSVAHCTTGLDLNTPGQGNVYMLGDMGSNADHVKIEPGTNGANGVFIGGNFEAYSDRIFNLQGNCNTTIIEPGYNLDGTQAKEPYLLNGNQLIFIGHTGMFGSGGNVAQFKGEGHVVLNPNVSINTQGNNINRQWVQGVFPAVGDNSLPPPGANNFLGIYLVVPRVPAYGPANLAFVNQNPDGTYFMDSLCASSVLSGANTFTSAQTYNASLTYNSTLTGTGASTITIDNGSVAPLSLRNTGGYYALAIRDPVTNADIAGFSSVGACIGQRFYSAAGGSAAAGAFQTNNFSLHDTATPHQMGVAVNGADAALVDPTGVTVFGVLHLPPIARPSSAAEGDIYVDSNDHHTYEWNGNAWMQLDN